jgi:hypothetical protein
VALIHARFLEPESLREHLRGAGSSEALERTSDTGALDDEAAGALTSAILRAGENGGTLDLEGADEWESRFLLIASLALADDALAAQLLEGGWLDRRGVGGQAFGSLPLRIIQRQVSRESFHAAREAVQFGWESELINLLESAALRAQRAAEEHVVLVRHQLVSSSSGSRADEPTGITALLAQLRELDLAALAGKTSGFTGADLEHLVELGADAAIERSISSSNETPITQADLELALGEVKPTAVEWLTTARNYARYANEAGQYDDVLKWLEAHGKA